MNIEKDIFKRGKIDFHKLLDYGFANFSFAIINLGVIV